MFFYQPIPSIPELFIVRVSDACDVHAEDTQWKLTDSSSFTNFRKFDQLTVRLNGSTTEESTLETVSVVDSVSCTVTESSAIVSAATASESLTVELSDSFSGSQSVAVVDSTLLSLTDSGSIASLIAASDSSAVGLSDAVTNLAAVITTTDSCVIQCQESVQPISVSAISSDVVSIAASDIFTGSHAFAVSDSLAVGLTESSRIASVLSASDSLAVGLTETVSQISAVITASDSAAVQFSESVTALALSFSLVDSLQVVAGDIFSGSQSVLVADTCAVQVGDTLRNASSVSTSESLSLVLGDIGTLSQVTISAADSVSVTIGEQASALQNTLLTVSEACAVLASESAAITNAVVGSDTIGIRFSDTVIGSQALSVSDDLGLLLSEDQFSSILAAASDTVTPTVSEAVTVFLDRIVLDAIALQVIDNGERQDLESAIPKSVQDVCAVLLEEGAVTELAGPYWAGQTGEEHGLVYADSYSMGRRDNPGRMRW